MKRPFAAISLPFRTLLTWFIAGDISFILIHGIGFTLLVAGVIKYLPEYLQVTEDRSIPEYFNYLKWFIVTVSLIWIAVRDRTWIPFCWGLIFLYVLFDDSFQLHETLGGLVSQRLGFVTSLDLSPQDLGEILVFSVMGFAMIALYVAAIRIGKPELRSMSNWFLLVFVGEGFFGVFIDAVHSIVLTDAGFHENGVSFAIWLLSNALGLMEDGGEMLVASLAVALTLAAPWANAALPPAGQGGRS